ncbi:hypothetical protein BDM02DRAFT_288023 [Thelephora ganbajun]|uniref:Uncharacterized protein n=1 Tax=Thelephora ganbajun TaxID=370292 RepID=A0ACB6Z8X7_THEGA|nr:hypothetical protein BDM02DRAFT_288023 [Thelephora ganbajun]
MSSYLLALFALLPIFWARIAQTQKSFAVCTEEYKWAFNSKGESPCDIGTELMAVCWGTGYTTYSLPPGASYWGPWKGYDTPCVCSTVTWCLFAACGFCQDQAAISWSMWSYNCSNTTIGSFPLNIPQQVIIPHWGYLSVGEDGRWNETAAKVDTQNQPLYSHHSPVGAIVGGVIGGLAVLVMAIALFVVLRRRLRREPAKMPPSTLYGPEGASPYRPGDITAQSTTKPSFVPNHLMHQRLYDPSDPSTFPPPLNHDQSSAAYTSPPGSPGNHPTIIY